jgi:predicted GNAT superfamily acetyltransferase
MTGLVLNIFTMVHNREVKISKGKIDTEWTHEPLTPLNIMFNTRWTIDTEAGQM